MKKPRRSYTVAIAAIIVVALAITMIELKPLIFIEPAVASGTSTVNIGEGFTISELTEGGVQIYWDSACTNVVTKIDWGTPEPGDHVYIQVYMKNVANVAVFMLMATKNWIPPEAEYYLVLGWTYKNQMLNASYVLPMNFTLYVRPDIHGITTFSVDITVSTIEYRALDITHDGAIDGADLIIFASVFGSTSGMPRYRADCDLNGDGIIDGSDIIMVTGYFGALVARMRVPKMVKNGLNSSLGILGQF